MASNETVFDVVKHVRNVLHGRIAECEAEVQSAHKIVTRLRRNRGRVKNKKKDGTNLFHAIVDKKIANVLATIPQNKRLVGVCEAALKILADYETVDDAFEVGSAPSLGGKLSVKQPPRYLPWEGSF